MMLNTDEQLKIINNRYLALGIPVSISKGAGKVIMHLGELDGKDITVPEWVDIIEGSGFGITAGKRVGTIRFIAPVKIADSTFEKASIAEVIGAEYIEEIGDYAFKQAQFINSVKLDLVSATKLGEKAFDTSNVVEVNLPNAEEIGKMCFYMCSALKEVRANKAIKVGMGAFRDSRIKNVVLESIVRLRPEVFYDCQELIEVNMPKVEEIGAGAFRRTGTIKRLELPNVKDIKERAFESSEIVELNCPMCETIGEGAFQYATKLKRASLGKVELAERRSFEYCGVEASGKTYIELPQCTEVAMNAFYATKANIVFGRRVTIAGDNAFGAAVSYSERVDDTVIDFRGGVEFDKDIIPRGVFQYRGRNSRIHVPTSEDIANIEENFKNDTLYKRSDISIICKQA